MDFYFLVVAFFLGQDPEVHIYTMSDADTCATEAQSYNSWARRQAYAECITKHVDVPVSPTITLTPGRIVPFNGSTMDDGGGNLVAPNSSSVPTR